MTQVTNPLSSLLLAGALSLFAATSVAPTSAVACGSYGDITGLQVDTAVRDHLFQVGLDDHHQRFFAAWDTESQQQHMFNFAIQSTRVNEKTAIVRVKRNSDGRVQRLTLSRTDGNWKVVRVKNLSLRSGATRKQA